MSKLQQSFDTLFEISNFNNDFLLIRSKSVSDLAHLGRTIFESEFDFVEEVITTEYEICIQVNANFYPAKLDLIKNSVLQEKPPAGSFQIPVFFSDHEDWKSVELVTGLNREDVISRLLQNEYSVAMFGFLPGFTYFNGLDESLHVPRKSIPSKNVESNSLAIGGRYLGIYAINSPGGWHVIGKIPISMLEIKDLPPIPLNPGDRIKLKAIDFIEFDRIKSENLTLNDFYA